MKSDSEWKWQLLITIIFNLLNWKPSDAQTFWQVAIFFCPESVYELCPSESEYSANSHHLSRERKSLVGTICLALGSTVLLLLSSYHYINRQSFVRPLTKKNLCNQMNCNNYAGVGKSRFIVPVANNTIIFNTRINSRIHNSKPTFAHPCICSWVLNSRYFTYE